jgi:pectate lyase
MKLSNNFTLAELSNSATAKRYGIENTPGKEEIKNLELIAKNILQPIRDHFDAPIHVISGYRSAVLNKKVGGAKTSQHLTGNAVDIDNDNTEISNLEIFNFIKDNLVFDQLIAEFPKKGRIEWVHVSLAKKNRKQVLVAKKESGITVYRPYKTEKDFE